MNSQNLLEVQQVDHFTILRFFDVVDAETVEKIRPIANESIPSVARYFIADMSKVEFLDSHGVGFFVSLLKTAHRNKGRLLFAGVHDQPLSVLKMVGFNGPHVAFYKTMEEAVALNTDNCVMI